MLEAILKAAPVAIVALDRQQRVVFWSDSAELMFGWRREETVGRLLPNLSPEAQAIHFAEGRDGTETTCIDRSGSAIPVRIWISPASDGTGYVWVFADHRDAQQARELAASAHRISSLFDATPDAILEIDDRGRIVLANPEAERMFQRSRDELLDLTVEELIPERFRGKHFAFRANYSAHPVRRPMGAGIDLYALRKDGSEFAVDIKLSPVAGRVMCVVRDVSDRRETEEKIKMLNQNLERRSGELAAANHELSQQNREVERANRLKSEFLASMSHELRTPLNTILGFSELLSEETAGALNDKQKRFVTHINRDAHHLLELINDILDLSKIEAGRLELHLEKFPMAVPAAEVLTSVRPLAANRGIALDSDLNTEIILNADRVRFKEILYNLLSNAIKFTPRDGRIWITSSQEDGSVHIVVGDTGIGISAADQEAIFESFRQASPTTKGVKEGTGLGLAITKRLVEQHGGRIWVESQPGEGSRFHLSFPAVDAESSVPLSPDQTRNAPLVLAASPQLAVREEISRWLELGGFEFSAAVSGADAVQQAAKLRPNLILLDIEISGKSGWETLHDLKTSAATSTIPVIIVSPTDERKMGTALGAADCLVKPLSQEPLIDAVRHALRSEDALRVLVVDDDPAMRQLIADTLLTEGHLPVPAGDAKEALRALAGARLDAVVLDLMLPGRDGFDLLREIRSREQFAAIPVLILTVKDLSDRDRQTLASMNAPVFDKGPGWRPALLQRLRMLPRPSTGKKVLVVDDNPAGREFVREALRPHVSSISEASDGKEALAKIRAEHPDLVFLDIQMPEMDGYHVLSEIRGDPALRDLRVVALTAFAMEGDRQRSLASGFDDYITKPVTAADLKAQLK